MSSNKAVGGCHCGNVRYTLDAEVPVEGWALRSCSCGFCVRHGGVYASHPSASLSICVGQSDRLGRYRFATASADFCFCKICGVLVFLTCEVAGQLYALVNMNTLDVRPLQLAEAPVVSFEGESPAARMERRQRNWIARVKLHLAG